jgi:HK97 family phage major capsid protein
MKAETIKLPHSAQDYAFRNEAADAIESLQERLLDIQEHATSIQARADAEARDLTEEEQTELDGVFASFEEVEAQIERRNRIAAQAEKLTASLGRKVVPEGSESNSAPVSHPRQSPRIEINDKTSRGSWGFRSFGEFAVSVRQGVRGNMDPRLVANAPSTYSTEGVGADGGFAVPPDFRQQIMEKVMGEASLLSRTDQLTTSSNSVTLPTDETTPWQSSGGVQAYWEGEAGQISQSKMALQNTNVRLNKLTALVPVTEELMEDAPTLDGYLRRKVPEKFDFAANLAIVNGSGVGRPKGILNADCLVTVAKEGSQVADTVVAENVIKMYSRMYAPCRQNAVWLINQDIEQQLMQANLKITNVAGTENVGGTHIYMPPGGLSAAPYGTLLGRPVLPTQACETLGDKGDIILADLSKYLSVVKTGGIRSDVSIHLWFDYDMAAYRFVFRVGGQPWWSSAVTPRDGSNTLSCFVTLAERA